jgi:hypothetical protein
MAENQFASDVRHFILINIDSIAQLEALLLLCANPAEKWDVAALAKRLYISEQETSKLLASLCDLGLTAISDDDPLRYVYQPESDELARMVDRLADVYGKYLVPVTNLVHSKYEAKQTEGGEDRRDPSRSWSNPVNSQRG